MVVSLAIHGNGAAVLGAEPVGPARDFGKFTPDVEWITPLGWGGASLKQEAAVHQDGPLFTHLEAVHLDFDRQEIIFIGKRETGFETVSANQLLDGLVLGLRSVEGRAPGVSIDPKPQQLGGLRNSDLMDVVYFGDVENTELGYTAWRADVLMKFLSFGHDNGVDGVAGSKRFYRAMQGIRGHQTELHYISQFGVSPGWQRFWIQQSSSKVEVSQDRATWLVTAKLEINTEKMTVKDGRLTSDPDRDAPSSEAFAEQLTDRYDDYARRFPSFHKLRIYAQLICVADALSTEATRDRQFAKQLWRLVRGHEVASYVTPTTTRAMVDTVRIPNGQLQLTGGVNLEPKKAAVVTRNSAAAAAMWDRISQGRRGEKWAVRGGGPTLHASAARTQRRTDVVQEDFRQGPIRVVRRFTPGAGTISPDWSLQLPAIQFASREVDGLPEMAWFTSGSTRQMLGRRGTVKIPGQASVQAYFSADEQTTLAVFADRLLVMQGQVGWRGRQPVARGNGRVLEFETLAATDDAPRNQRVTKEVNSQGEVRFRYQGDRLVAMEGVDAKGRKNTATFAYENDQLQGIYGDAGKFTEYFYDGERSLRYVGNEKGKTLSYVFDDELVGMYAPGATGRPRPNRRQSPWIVDSGTASARSEVRQQPSDILYISVEPDTSSGTAGYVLMVDGEPLLRDSTIRTFGPRVLADEALAELLEHPKVRRSRGVVLCGQPDVALQLAPLLQAKADGLHVYSASDLKIASANLDSDVPLVTKPHWVVLDDTLTPSVAKEMQSLIQEMEILGEAADRLLDGGVNDEMNPVEIEGDTVVIVGHNDAAFQTRLRELAATGQLRGKDIVLLTCGNPMLMQLADELLRQYRVRSVTGFSEPIDQKRLPALVEGMHSAAKQLGGGDEVIKRRHRSIQKWIKRGLERLTPVTPDKEQPIPAGDFPDQTPPGEDRLFERFGRTPKRWREPADGNMLPGATAYSMTLAC